MNSRVPGVAEQVLECARAARGAAVTLAPLPRAVKDAALRAMADALVDSAEAVLAANRRDVAAGRDAGLADGLIDRLTLTASRLDTMADALREIAALPDPVGELVRGATLPNGLRLRQVRVPLGVLAVIYEARPNVTVDAAGLAIKSGNAVLLRGSATARASNEALVCVLSAAAEKCGLPAAAIQLVPGSDRESVTALLRARGLVDLAIPRGGAGLIRHVVDTATVPVIETGVGNCHVYVDSSADPDMATAIVLDAKTSRPSVCNAAESLLVHRDIAAEFLPRVLPALHAAGVTVHGDESVARYHGQVVPATEQDWETEYLSLDIAAGLVDSVHEATEHIRRYGTGHTEAIIADSAATIDYFTAHVDAAAIMVNVSTRFTDGAEFGFGAEIGISTQKMHARGPLGLPELTTTTYLVTGNGQTRG